MAEEFEEQAEEGEIDFLSAWLHVAIGGSPQEQDSRQEGRSSRLRRRKSQEAAWVSDPL